MSTWRDEAGSASALVVGVLAALVIVGLALSGAASALVERHRVEAAADAAALAAAASAAGLLPGAACGAAARLTAASGLRLDSCRQDGTTVTVTVESQVGPVPVEAAATAGQTFDALGERRVDAKK